MTAVTAVLLTLSHWLCVCERGAFEISLHCLIEVESFNSVKSREIAIQHDSMAANEVDFIADVEI